MICRFFFSLAATYLFLSTIQGAIKIESFQGEQIAPYVDTIVQLCNGIYREYPYFYNGEDEGYRTYLESYAHSKEALICLAFDGEKAVGIAAGIPMSERNRYQETLLEQGYDLATFFYVGEFGLSPEYKGEGIEQLLYQTLEDFAKKSGNFTTLCLWEMEGSSQIDSSYLPSTEFWKKNGFIRHPELNFVIFWTHINETQESSHKAVYWLKIGNG